jgi:integrase
VWGLASKLDQGNVGKYVPVKGAPGVYKRVGKTGKVSYRVFIDTVGDDGKRAQEARTFYNFEDARDWHNDHSGSRKRRAPKTNRTLDEALDALHQAKAFAPNTLDLHRYIWSALSKVDSDLGRTKVRDVTPARIEATLGKLKPHMAIKARLLLHRLFVREGVEPNPAHRVKDASTRAERKEQGKAKRRLRILNDDELARLVDATPDRWKAMIEAMAWVGLRPGEAVALKVGDFDALHRTLHVRTALSGDVKTGEPREVRLPKIVADVLSEHITRTYEGVWDSQAPMFPKSDGQPIATKNEFDAWRRRVFSKAAERAGVNGGLSPNNLRHHAAAFAIGQGADVYAVQKMLGHAKPSITLDVYGYLWDASAGELADRLDAAIKRSRKPATEAAVSSIR